MGSIGHHSSTISQQKAFHEMSQLDMKLTEIQRNNQNFSSLTKIEDKDAAALSEMKHLPQIKFNMSTHADKAFKFGSLQVKNQQDN